MDDDVAVQVPDQRYAADAKLYVVFHMKAVQNGFKSEQEGTYTVEVARWSE